MLERVVIGRREVRWVRRMRQSPIAQLAQLQLRCGMCGRSLSWRRITPFILTKLGHICCSFWYILSIRWQYFSAVNVLSKFKKLRYMTPATDHQTVTIIFFRWSTGFGKCLWILIVVQPLSRTPSFIVEDPFLITSYNSIKKWAVVVAQKSRRRHLKTAIFCSCTVREGPIYRSFSIPCLFQMAENFHVRYIQFCSMFSNSCELICVD